MERWCCCCCACACTCDRFPVRPANVADTGLTETPASDTALPGELLVSLIAWGAETVVAVVVVVVGGEEGRGGCNVSLDGVKAAAEGGEPAPTGWVKDG